MRLTMDFETRSASNLKKEGAFKYSLDPTTRPTCLAFKIFNEPTIYFLPFEMINKQWDQQSEKLKTLWVRLINEGYEFSAHNAFFENAIYSNILVRRYGWPNIPLKQFRCTAAKAAACALPRNLEGAGEAMNLSVQKDKRGYVAMMATCKPTKAYNAWHKIRTEMNDRLDAGKLPTPKQQKWFDRHEPCPPMFLSPDTSPEVFKVLYEYCKIDVKAEEALDRALPDLNPEEQEIWFLNQRINWRGIPFDEPAVKKIIGIMEEKNREGRESLDEVTMGLITKPGAIKSILEFLEIEGIKLPNLQAKTIEDALKSFDLTDNAAQLLELRKTLSLASLRKYQGFLDRGVNGRIQDVLLYHGASTGREAAKGLQFHNLPRGLIKVDKFRPYAAIENILECSREMLELIYSENLGLLFSAVLRNIIIPTEEHELYVADFAKIEVAVLWWLAGNEPGLKILRSGKDPYKYMAAANTHRKYEDIPDDGNERQLGKAQVLGCGFGMGHAKFKLTAWTMYRLSLTETQSRQAVSSYRSANAAVPKLWKAYENAAIAAVDQEGKTFKAGKCKFCVHSKFLWVELPSKRRIAYRDPRVTNHVSDYGERRTLEFWAPNSKTKKWNQERTWGGSLTENIVQAVARDLLMSGLVRLEKANYIPLFSVHDEGICERRAGEGSVEEFSKILCEVPAWGEGLPIDAKGWTGPRYRKG